MRDRHAKAEGGFDANQDLDHFVVSRRERNFHLGIGEEHPGPTIPERLSAGSEGGRVLESAPLTAGDEAPLGSAPARKVHPRVARDRLVLRGATLHNLQDATLDVGLGTLFSHPSREECPDLAS